MRPALADLKLLRLPLALSLALVAAAVGCALAAHHYLGAIRTQAAAAAAQRAAAQARLASVSAQVREIESGLPQFQALLGRGIVGAEDRLNWIESVSAIRKERRLFDIRFSVEPQRELDYPGFARGGSVKFTASRAKISMGLLHEEDLLDFIDDLARRGKFYLAPRSCDVQRAAPTDRSEALAPQLQADCQFDLITVRVPMKPAKRS